MITGTFLDEISHDIPSANWGPEEWERDFAAMRDVGIDTVILIRAGYRDRATFDSKVLRKLHPHLIVGDDLVGMFLTLAERYGQTFWFGTYDSGDYWNRGLFREEVDVNRTFADEVVERYGDAPAFGGWYISHEIDAFDETVMNVYAQLSDHLRGLKELPILISPYIRGPKQFTDTLSLDEHVAEWRRVFERIEGKVDVVAFQDGNVEYARLPDYLAANAELAAERGLTTWSNVETFERDVHIKFPPIGWPKLRHKMEAALAAGVDKLITFEFSHFLSPNSMYPSARSLHRRYREWLAARESDDG